MGLDFLVDLFGILGLPLDKTRTIHRERLGFPHLYINPPPNKLALYKEAMSSQKKKKTKLNKKMSERKIVSTNKSVDLYGTVCQRTVYDDHTSALDVYVVTSSSNSKLRLEVTIQYDQRFITEEKRYTSTNRLFSHIYFVNGKQDTIRYYDPSTGIISDLRAFTDQGMQSLEHFFSDYPLLLASCRSIYALRKARHNKQIS